MRVPLSLNIITCFLLEMQLMSFSLYLRFGTNRLVCFFLSFFVYCCPYGLSTMPLPMPPPFLYRLKSRPKGSPLYFAANACFVIPFTFCTFTSNFTFRVRVFFFFFSKFFSSVFGFRFRLFLRIFCARLKSSCTTL